jgi:hypothetical protein
MLLIQCAWMIRHDHSGLPHPRPQDPTGLAWRVVKVHKAGHGESTTRQHNAVGPSTISHALPGTGRAAYAQDGARGPDQLLGLPGFAFVPHMSVCRVWFVVR